MTSDAEFGQSEYEMTVSPQEDGSYELTATGDPVAFGFKSIVSKTTNAAYKGGSSDTDLQAGTIDYIVRYLRDVNLKGELDKDDVWYGHDNDNTFDAPKEVGKYLAVAMTWNAFDSWRNTTGWAWDDADGLAGHAGVIAVPFEIVPQDFDGLYAFEVNNANGADTSDRTFTYDGTPIQDRLGLAIGNKVLTEGADYHIEFKNSVPEDSADAGTYTVCVFGHGVYQDAYAELEVTVGQLNLATADIYADVYTDSDRNVKRADAIEVNGKAATALVVNGSFTIDQLSYTDTSRHTWNQEDKGNYKAWNNTGTNDAGGYNFTIHAQAGQNNVVGSRDITVNVVADDLEAVYYGSTVLYDATDTSTDFDGQTFYGDEWTYDASAITAQDPAGTPFTGQLDKALAGPDFAAVDAPSDGGVYYLTVSSPVAADYSFGHSERVAFTYFKGGVDSDTVEAIATIHGNNVEFGSTYTGLVYDGEPVVPAITVTAGDATLVEGTDYTVEYTTPEGEVVDSMVDAGTYTVTVVLSGDYKLTGGENSFDVVIAKRQLENIGVTGLTAGADGIPGYLYTGSAIEPQFVGSYQGTDGVWREIVLDPSWYQVSNLVYRAHGSEKFVPADSVLEVGSYEANVTPTDDCVNYTWELDDQDVTRTFFEVIATAAFADVASDAWYADEVAAASALRYVKGMGNNMFFPNADMTRAQFAQVVYNMAGEPEVGNGGLFGTYPTKFADVESTAWYAKAVSWATEAGIVNGTSETTFDPEGDITREQIATMLYRYAGNGAQADLTALDSFVDADQVSGWAANAVAWAVEEGYMEGKGANDLQPQDTATRAEIAALAVRVQPEPLPRS